MPALGQIFGLGALGNAVGGEGYIDQVKGLFGSNLIGYWPMAESPAGNDYLTFNGSTTSIDAGSGASIDDLPAGGDLTVDGWVYYTTVGDQDSIIGKSDSGLTTSGWVFYTSTAPALRWRVNNDGGDVVVTETISAGSWIHIVGFYDNSTKKSRVALNGTWGTLSGAASGAYIADAGNDLIFSGLGNGEFDGKMGWMRISDNDRFDGENGTGFTPPARTTIPTVDANTVSLWPMNEGYGSVAGDIGANGNDGTITNGDWGAYPTAVDLSPQGNDGHTQAFSWLMPPLLPGLGAKLRCLMG